VTKGLSPRRRSVNLGLGMGRKPLARAASHCLQFCK
jgi:hypothetical protein